MSLKNLSESTALVLLLIVGYSCSKGKNDSSDPSPITKPSLTAKIDSTDYNLDAAAITSTYYSTDGDDVKALKATGRLNTTGNKIVFFINDFKDGTIELSKKAGTSFNPGNSHLKINAVVTTPPVQTYVQYIKDGNTYYAVSGTITVIIKSNGTATVKWDIKFTDAKGRSFNSSGSFDLTNFQANIKPKTDIVDPTPVSDKPTIESISPQKGFALDTVRITGTNFSAVKTDNEVSFNGTKAFVSSATTTQLVVIAPAAASTGSIIASIKNGTAVTGPVFTYLLPATITGISPASGKTNDTVTITGTNFSTVLAENTVFFKTAIGIMLTATSTKLTVRVPAGGSTGAITVNVNHARTTITGPVFAYTNKPVLQSISPAQGNPGDVIAFTGTNFSTTPATNIVFFNGVRASVLTATATKLTVKVPASATTGKIILSVDGNSANEALIFTVNPPKTSLDWAEVFSSINLQKSNQMVSTGSSIMVTGGPQQGYLYYSADGKSYTDVYNNLPFGQGQKPSINIIKADNNNYYVTTSLGIAKSTNGTNWVKIVPDATSPNRSFTGITVNQDKITLLAGKKVYKSPDGGSTWSSADISGPGTLNYICSFANEKYMFAVDTSKNFTSKEEKIFYQSMDQGRTWRETSGVTGIYNYNLGERDFLTTSSYNVFCSFSYKGSGQSLGSTRVYRSVNQGATWEDIGSEACSVIKTAGDIVAYGTAYLNLSLNNGDTFTKYTIPTGYTLGGIVITPSYYYISAYTNTGSNKIFRATR